MSKGNFHSPFPFVLVFHPMIQNLQLFVRGLHFTQPMRTQASLEGIDPNCQNSTLSLSHVGSVPPQSNTPAFDLLELHLAHSSCTLSDFHLMTELVHTQGVAVVHFSCTSVGFWNIRQPLKTQAHLELRGVAHIIKAQPVNQCCDCGLPPEVALEVIAIFILDAAQPNAILVVN